MVGELITDTDNITFSAGRCVHAETESIPNLDQNIYNMLNRYIKEVNSKLCAICNMMTTENVNSVT